MQLKLRTKLIISYSLLSLFLIASLFAFTSWTIEKQFRNYLLKQQAQASAEIVQAVREEFAGQRPHPRVLKEIGERAFKQNTIMYIDNIRGSEIFRATQKDKDKDKDKDKQHSWSNVPRKLAENFSKTGSAEQKYPIVVNNQQVATLTLIFPTQLNDADDYFMEVLTNILGQTALLFLLIAIGVGVYMANRIAQPLKLVLEQTKRVEQGDYTVQIPHSSDTVEIAALITAVNNLAHTLELQKNSQKRMARDYTHEIRTPLAAIQSNLEGMIDGVLPTTTERLESCRLEILRLARLISEVDKLVELETQPQPLHKENLRLDLLLRRIAGSFEQQLLEKNINVQLNLSEISCTADSDKLSQVIINLLSNALKYTPNHGTISITTQQANHTVGFSVADTGSGIHQQDLPYIFDHLYKADPSRNRTTGGSGIGLSVSRAIAQAHGGDIQAISTPNKGSIFTVILPK